MWTNRFRNRTHPESVEKPTLPRLLKTTKDMTDSLFHSMKKLPTTRIVITHCAVVGGDPSVLSVIVSVGVSEAVRIVLREKPRLANRIFPCNIEDLKFEEIETSKAENCPACGLKQSSPAIPLKRKLIAQNCGREGKKVFVITPRRNLELSMNALPI